MWANTIFESEYALAIADEAHEYRKPLKKWMAMAQIVRRAGLGMALTATPIVNGVAVRLETRFYCRSTNN